MREGSGRVSGGRRGRVISHLRAAYLYVVVPVVVEVQHAVDLGVGGHVQLLCALHALAHRLAGVLLHLDVVELSADKRHKLPR